VVGLIEARQTEGKKTFQNDRYVGVAECSLLYEQVNDVSDLPPTVVKEVERFFIAYNETRGRKFSLRAVHGRKVALERLRTLLGH
jgi:inorganic pyrophosphatase